MAEVLVERTVAALEQAGSRIRVRLNDGGEITVDHVVLLFGYRPNTSEPWIAELALEKDPRGYLVVDGNMETSRRGVFAVGDVANPAHPCNRHRDRERHDGRAAHPAVAGAGTRAAL